MPPGPDTIGSGPGGRGPAESAAGRIPPQDIEAEVATLGSMLIEGEAAGIVLEQLQPEDFYRSAHQEIFRAVRDIYVADHQADVILLRDYLTGKGKHSCSFTLFCADTIEPLDSFTDNMAYKGKRFYIVDNCRIIVQTVRSRIGRSMPRHSRMAFHGCYQC